MTSRILLVDDDPLFTEQIAALLTREKHSVAREHNSKNVLALLRKDSFDLVLLDIQMPDPDGIALLKQIMQLDNSPQVIMFSGAASLQQAADSIKLGAADFLEKPPDVNRLLITVKNCLDRNRLTRENRSFRQGQLAKYEIIGHSRAIENLKETIAQVAQTDSRVLIWGETGTGKELAASQIHYQSSRSANPLVKLNCAAIPTELAESELFGHKKGAFTGAHQDHSGKFAVADTGSLIMDEITELPLNLQSKLLRTLESSEIEIVGGTTPQKINVRLISISGKNIEQAIAQDKFRSDLYYRINTIPVFIPPLRDRREDIPLLIEHFFKHFREISGNWQRGYHPDLVAKLIAGEWPGNIRQLKNSVERLFFLSRDDLITAKSVDLILNDNQLEINPFSANPDDNLLKSAVGNFERCFLMSHLQSTSGNIADLAKLLNLDRGNLYKKLKKYNLV